MGTFLAVTDDVLSQRIKAATRRIVFIAPAISKRVATALENCLQETERLSVTVLLDPSEDAYRIGYGEREGLEHLEELRAKNNHLNLRSQPGLRIGILLADDDVLVWSPTPRAVEGQRETEEPNGLDLNQGNVVRGRPASSGFSGNDKAAEQKNSVADIIQNAVGGDDSSLPSEQVEIGRKGLKSEEIAATLKTLKENPPAPFDLAQKTRVFSTKFQYVEHEIRGIGLTNSEIKISSLLLNPDVSGELQALFDTKIKPFAAYGAVDIEVPALVEGEIAYNAEGKEITVQMTQAEIEKLWQRIIKKYLRNLPGFGWLIARAKKEKFKQEVEAFERIQKVWVEGFRKEAKNKEETIINGIINLIVERVKRSLSGDKLDIESIKKMVRAGIQEQRVTGPSIKIVFKEISWESSRDEEFTRALRKALSPEELKGWFEVFTAVRQRNSDTRKAGVIAVGHEKLLKGGKLPC